MSSSVSAEVSLRQRLKIPWGRRECVALTTPHISGPCLGWRGQADPSPAAVLLDLSVWSQTLPSIERRTLQHSALAQVPCPSPFFPLPLLPLPLLTNASALSQDVSVILPPQTTFQTLETQVDVTRWALNGTQEEVKAKLFVKNHCNRSLSFSVFAGCHLNSNLRHSVSPAVVVITVAAEW